jgi:hypothetical protein
MAKLPHSSAAARGFRDTVFLLAVGVISLVCGAVSFYAWQTQHGLAVSATASAEDDAPRAPLPAGPRKYQ